MSKEAVYAQYNNAFLAATPAIQAEILDLTVKFPTWLSDLTVMENWESNANQMQELEFRGSLPEIERGFNNWKRLAENSGCQPCVDDCNYQWTSWGGTGMNRRMVSLMRREFRTDPFCVKEIGSTHDYETIFSKTIENIYTQRSFFMENSIGLNFLSGIAKKLLVDSSGLKGNSSDPYSYRPIGGAVLGKLNLRVTSKIYEGLRRRTDCIPFDVVNGAPIYAISASAELIDDLYVNDANARQDLRFSSAADALLTKYNFMDSLRGQFINAPILYPRRFNVVSGAWIEVLPFVNGLPAEVGSFSDLNPAWENASYEEVLFYGAKPFKVYHRNPLTTLGAGTSFGPAGDFLSSWLWVNPQTNDDPFQRQGFFAAEIEMALSAQHSQSVYGLIVPRPAAGSIAEFYQPTACPPTPVDCDNDVPAVGCPCPLILSVAPNPVVPGDYFFTFAVAVAAEVDDPVQLGLATGAYVTGTVVAISDDGLTAELALPAGITPDYCTKFTTIFCDNTLGCSANVVSTSDCRSGQVGSWNIQLSNPIKAVTAAQIITAYFGDGTTQNLAIVSVDVLTNTWTVKYAAGFGPTDDPTGAGTDAFDSADVVCDRNGIVSVCVPTSTDATCSACSKGPIVTPCGG